MIRAREVSVVEVITAYLDHIERVNPLVNAIISLRPRRDLLEEAAAADVAVSRGGEGWPASRRASGVQQPDDGRRPDGPHSSGRGHAAVSAGRM